MLLFRPTCADSNKPYMKLQYLLLLVSLLLASCSSSNKPSKANNGAFAKAPKAESTNIDRIVDSGELIIATTSGPDTYFDYQGVGMGLQYALAEDFAATLGVGVRVELSNDTTEMLRKLQNGDVDLIALQLPEGFCQKNRVETAGARNAQKRTSWAIKTGAKDLAESLNHWFGDGVEINVEKKEKNRMRERREVRRKVRAPFISREKGIISTYDSYFKEAARHTGWDWRLIAAQCYQESGFDPNAVSGAGAKGLMQLMPATARQMDLPEERVFAPKENVAAASRYIRHLQGCFKDINDPEERIKFILASYNGGRGHINDAQALARKYGGNPRSWADVGQYVRKLSDARYYRDPVVKYGYMIGSETYGYVQSIMERWRQYGGHVRNLTAPGTAPMPYFGPAAREANGDQTPRKRNRYSKERKILSPEEMRKEANK